MSVVDSEQLDMATFQSTRSQDIEFVLKFGFMMC